MTPIDTEVHERENPDALGKTGTMAEGQVESRLPEGWVPEGTVFRMLVRREDDHLWESLIPEFSIAGMGKSLDEAAENAIELLEDYLLLCAGEGKSLDACRRPLPVRLLLRLLAAQAFATLASMIRRGPPRFC